MAAVTLQLIGQHMEATNETIKICLSAFPLHHSSVIH